jgi:putative ABC transport system permease protein
MLRLGDNVAQSLCALRSHGLRSALTTLGLTMGVAALITVVSLVRGANAFVEEKIANLGSNVFQISKNPFTVGDLAAYTRAIRFRRIEYSDMLAIRQECRGCMAVGASAAAPVAVRRGAAELPDVQLQGQSLSMSNIEPREVVLGRYFTRTEEDHSSYVCVIGDKVRETLFGSGDPLGGRIRVGHQEFTVVGTYQRIGSVLGQDSDTFAVIPISTFFRMRGNRQTLTVNVKAHSAASVDEAIDEARQILRARRQLRPKQPDEFFVGTKDTYLSMWKLISGAFFQAFLLVSLVSTFVGGIVIMNVMLVSVTERTKEIGLRRAVGASQGDIRRQFITEALAQCAAGGLAGVALGALAAAMVREFGDLPARMEVSAAVFGVAFSSLVGLLFGIAPAVRASRLDPVEALRAEAQ